MSSQFLAEWTSATEGLGTWSPHAVAARLKQLWWNEARANGALPLLEAPGGRRATGNQALSQP